MFARRVDMHLKPNCVPEFTQRLEKEVIPLLRKQKGFQDEITFVTTGGKDALAISLWDRPEDAEAYNRGTYPEVAKILSRVVEGTPRVESYEVSNSTFHEIASPATAPSRLMHTEILPLLNNEKGFRKDLTLLDGNNDTLIH